MTGGRSGGFQVGDLIRARGREWTVESIDASDGLRPLSSVELACIADDAQGELLRVVIDSEIGARRLEDSNWDEIAHDGTDDPQVLAAHLKAVTWKTSTAADRDLFQAPFRAGIRLEPYQLLPLSKALKLPRVNLLIADDVGLGKTVEAGLVLRELLLRKRVDFTVVVAPASMTAQWQDELAQKFGLSFTIVDRDYLAAVRRNHGFGANPWAVGSRFIISHSLLADETYAAGLVEMLGEFRPRAIFILDEAHHAAPASGVAYATDSQFTRAIRNTSERFEHRLFLSATPHNGHSNSFSSLLEILDPQRFTRGVPVEPSDLEPVMVRRLKSDLIKLNVAKFPKRFVEPIVIGDLPPDAPELILSEQLEAYRKWCETGLDGSSLQNARFLHSGLQQRLLSSISAFTRTLSKHLETLKRHRDKVPSAPPEEEYIVDLIASGSLEGDLLNEEDDDGLELDLLQEQEDELAEIATEAVTPALRSFDEAITQVQAMLTVARQHERAPDARVRWLIQWIKAHLLDPSGTWNTRRLIIFTEWEDTRLWLERRLREAFSETENGDNRIATFTGITGQDRREEVKRAFNADPDREPLRILLCTDAAREGINLQTRCHDLIHFDLPWNPSRLEQRNGRIDRMLQPSDTVYCRYFNYAQRAEDRVLDALVRKTEVIHGQLGSAGQVLANRIHRRLSHCGIAKDSAEALASEIEREDGSQLSKRAVQEMADQQDRRLDRLQRDLAQLGRELDQARKQVGVAPSELRHVVEVAFSRDDVPLEPVSELGIEDVFRIDPSSPVFAKDPTWADLFDELREGRAPKRRKLAEWRAEHPVRAIAFDAPVLADGSDAPGVVHLHLEHRLVRRLLSRFISHGFQKGLNRASVVYGPGRQPRVVLVGRLALYGPGGARLHEEIIPITAYWSEAARAGQGLKPFGEIGEQTTLGELEDALRQGLAPGEDVVTRLVTGAQKDVADLRPALEERASAAIASAKSQLAEIAGREAEALTNLLTAQRDRIQRTAAGKDSDQLELDLTVIAERHQREADRRHWESRLESIEKELAEEPSRLEKSYEVRAQRLEPVGIVYLWPRSA